MKLHHFSLFQEVEVKKSCKNVFLQCFYKFSFSWTQWKFSFMYQSQHVFDTSLTRCNLFLLNCRPSFFFKYIHDILLLKVYGWKKSFQDSYSSSEIFQRHFHLLKSLSNNISSLTMMFWKILSVLIRLPMIFLRPEKSFGEWCPSSRMFSVWKSLTKSTSRLEKSFDDKLSSWKIFTRIFSVLTSLSIVNFHLPKELSKRRSSFKDFSRREIVIKEL